MGQILSNIWNWLCANESSKDAPKSDDHHSNYQTFSLYENQLKSHYINILDDQPLPVPGSSSEVIKNHDNNNNFDALASHNVVDFSSGYEDISKHQPVPVSGSSSEVIQNHVNNINCLSSSLIEYKTNLMADLSSGYRDEDANKKMKMNKESSIDCDDEQVMQEIVLDKSVTTTISHVGKIGKIGPYNTTQRILLVGEGDFSFSACLAVAFGAFAVNITATSLNSKKYLNKNYAKFNTNRAELTSRGSTVLHGVDATDMFKHPVLGSMIFDRIIFNFPHAGKFGKSDTELLAHQKLIRGFFKNAKKMIEEEGGEIHITSKSNGFFLEWDIPKIGSDHGLKLIQQVKFKRSKYPGYNTKYGFGGDKDFDCNPSKTYKFGWSLE